MGKKMTKSVRKQLLNVLFLFVLIGITLLVLVLTSRELDFNDIRETFRSCNPWWLVGAGVAMLTSVLFEALSVHCILRRLGEKPKFTSSIVYATSDVYYSAITPSASGGQPASAYYMVKDGIGAGKASFTLVFNLVAYTAAIIILALVALILRPGFYGQIDNWFARLLIILGFVLQGILLAFFIACMYCGGAVKKCGNGLVTLLTKMHIVKKPDKWRERIAREVEKYAACRGALKQHPTMVCVNLLCNLGQRVSHVLIAAFVCLAARPQTDFISLCVLEALVVIGYNSIPLPGGVGAFEFLYMHIYMIAFEKEFIIVAMMVTRIFSFYLRTILSGIYTLIYHVRLVRRDAAKTKPPEGEGPIPQGESEHGNERGIDGE